METTGWTVVIASLMGVFSAIGVFLVTWIKGNTRLVERVDQLNDRVFKLQDDVRDCHEEREDLKRDLGHAQRRLEILESITGAQPTVPAPGVIIADFQGKILEFSPSLSPSLGWMPSELWGHSIEELVPPDLLGSYRAALQKAIQEGYTIDPIKKIYTYCLDRRLNRIPIVISLRKWEQSHIMTATVQVRSSALREPVVPAQ